MEARMAIGVRYVPRFGSLAVVEELVASVCGRAVWCGPAVR
jgi:hypothetical protein